MNADYILLPAALALVLFSMLAGDRIIDVLLKKGWLLKLAQQLGMDIKEEEK